MGKKNDVDGGHGTGKPKKRGLRETSKRLRGGADSHLQHRSSLDWRLDQREVCDLNGSEADIVAVETLLEVITKSRTGKSLMAKTTDDVAAVKVVYDQQTPVSQFYMRADGAAVITLNPYRPKGDLINLLTRELRRAWQYQQGVLVNPLSFEPDEAILVNRAQQADALMISIRVAWELKLQGIHESWDYLIGSPVADVGRTFEIKAQTDFRTLNNGQAARAAYDKFFEDARTKAHDKQIIHQMLLDETGYIKSSQPAEKVSMELFQRMGEMPYGRNYLCMGSAREPTDMCYSTVEDRSNANFLWFIKFERSFQEKELEMVNESVKLSAEIVDFAKWSLRQDAEPKTQD